MTLIELLFFFTMVTLAGLVAGYVHPIGGWLLSIPVFIAGILLLPGVMFALNVYRNWAYCGARLMSPCVCGGNRFKAEMAENGFHMACQQCNRRFDREKNRVYLLSDDDRKPYMELVKYQGWINASRREDSGST